MEKGEKDKILDIVKITIIIFTISVLIMNVVQAGKPNCKGGCSPAIISYDPLNLTIYDNPPATETFSITVNQTVSVTWFLDGAVHKTDNSVSTSSDIITESSIGMHNVTAVAQNVNGSVSQTWTWNVYPPPQIVYSDPAETIVNDTDPNTTRSFQIILDQDTYGTLCFYPSYSYTVCYPPRFIPAGQSWVTTPPLNGDYGTNIVTMNASNNNGTVSKSWTWILNYDPLFHPPPNITQYDPETPLNVALNTGKIFKFQTDVAVDFVWCKNGDCDTRTTDWSSYCLNSWCSRTYTFDTPGTYEIVVNVSALNSVMMHEEHYPVYANKTWIVNVS